VAPKLPSDLDLLACEFAAKHQLDVNLVRAISLHESAGGSRWRVRYEPHFRHLVRPAEFAKKHVISALQKMSWGPMQIMGAVAREDGFTDHLTKLTDPKLAYHWSCIQLSQLVKKYADETDVIAAWNWGSVQRLESGRYANQVYVDLVTPILKALRA
jgi:uncharacterized protein YihD (DUF1040 family)